MSPFWRPKSGTEPPRPRRDRRPRVGLRPEVSALEGRQLQAIVMQAAVPNKPVIKGINVSPQVLFPSDGRYVPISISGGITSVYTMTFERAYNIFPKPAYTANELAGLPLPDPTKSQPPPSSGTYPVVVAGSKTHQTVSFTLKPGATSTAGTFVVHLPGYQYSMDVAYAWTPVPTKTSPGFFVVAVKTLPISSFEMSVINQRLNDRVGPTKAVLQTTDQYRQDEPNRSAPLNLLVSPDIEIASQEIIPKIPTKFQEQVFVPLGMSITRWFSYNFQIHLQALKNAGTGGRQYILNVSAVDADDGGSVNAAVVVPPNA